jgi:probable rRNA maturation factor
MTELMDTDDAGSSTAARRHAGPDVTVDIVIEGAQWRTDVPGAQALVHRAACAALGGGKTRHDLAVAVVLTDDARVRDLNLAWRGIDKATNVLSFPAHDLVPGKAVKPVAGQPADQPIELGDVVLARETVLREAAAQGKSAGDHLSHLVIHGVLHLLGYHHDGDVEAERMESLERALLGDLDIADPYGRS